MAKLNSFYDSKNTDYGSFYSGSMAPPTKSGNMLVQSGSEPGTTVGGYVERGIPQSAQGSPYMTAQERALFNAQYGSPVPTGAQPTQVASVPMPRPRPG